MHHRTVRGRRNCRSPTPVLAEFERNITPLLSDVVRNKTPPLSDVVRNMTPPLSDVVRNKTPLLSDVVRNKTPLLKFSSGMYINSQDQLQKIKTKRQISPHFAKDLFEEFSSIKVQPYDDLHTRNCCNRNWRNRKKRKMSLQDITEHQECTCIDREKNELLGRHSRFVRTQMLSQKACSRQHLLFRCPLYSEITVSNAELPQCVSVEQYKLATLDKAKIMNYKHIAH